MLGSDETAPRVEPFIVVRLERGWRLDPESGTFRRSPSEGEGLFDPSELLPESSRLKPMIPSLSGTSTETLTEWELDLARYLHLFPGEDVDLDELVERVKSWDCVETAYRPPEIALP